MIRGGCRRVSCGAGTVGLVVTCAIVVVIAGLFFERWLYYREYSEKMAMELTALDVRSGLRLKLGELIRQRRFDRIPALAGENPVDWLAAKPANYAGEFDEPGLDRIAPGSWYFDRRRAELVYRPRQTRFLGMAGGDDPRIRYKVTMIGPAARAEGGEQVEWARLSVATPYQWF